LVTRPLRVALVDPSGYSRPYDHEVARALGPGKTVVTVAVDTGLKYLAGDLFQV